jgi:Tfp pilus assembly protein PilF
MDRAPAPWRLALFLLALGVASSPAPADVIVLVSGGEIPVSNWWRDGATIFYETDAGVVGVPRSEVAEIRADPTTPLPSYRAAARATPPAAETAGTGTPPPAADRPELPALADLKQAIAQLDRERRRAGASDQRARIEQRLADLWVLRARRHLADADENDATVAYEKALELVPLHAQARVELGWLALSRGAVRRAQALAETGLAGDPGNGWLLELRGEILYRDNRLDDALEAFVAALERRPGDARLTERVAQTRRDLAAERDYRRADSQHFVVRYDGERDEAAGELLLDLLEEAFDELADELDAYVGQPITVILYTREQFRATTGAGSSVGGLFDGKIRLPVGGVERVTPALRRVARHELVHALLHAKGHGRVPRWLHEGLAQLLEPRAPDSVRAALALSARRGERLDLEPFSYPKALSFTAFLEERYSRTRVLWLIDLLDDRLGEDEAFLRAFGSPREEVIEEWRRSLSRKH